MFNECLCIIEFIKCFGEKGKCQACRAFHHILQQVYKFNITDAQMIDYFYLHLNYFEITFLARKSLDFVILYSTLLWTVLYNAT